MADLLFLSYHVKVTADRRSAESMCLVKYRVLALAALPRFGVPWRHGRRIWKLQVATMVCHPQGGAPLPAVVDFGSSSLGSADAASMSQGQQGGWSPPSVSASPSSEAGLELEGAG